MSSSSAVHLPLLSPTFSQHGALPIFYLISNFDGVQIFLKCTRIEFDLIESNIKYFVNTERELSTFIQHVNKLTSQKKKLKLGDKQKPTNVCNCTCSSYERCTEI